MPDTLELGLVLVTVTGIAALIGSIRPRLRIAPVMLLRDRIIEIGLGGLIDKPVVDRAHRCLATHAASAGR